MPYCNQPWRPTSEGRPCPLPPPSYPDYRWPAVDASIACGPIGWYITGPIDSFKNLRIEWKIPRGPNDVFIRDTILLRDIIINYLCQWVNNSVLIEKRAELIAHINTLDLHGLMEYSPCYFGFQTAMEYLRARA